LHSTAVRSGTAGTRDDEDADIRFRRRRGRQRSRGIAVQMPSFCLLTG